MADLTKYEEFVDNLAMLDDEEMRFEYILDLAKLHKNDPFPDEWKTEANLMHGCMSRVWIVPDRRDARYYFRGHSDAAIVNGLVAMMTASFSGLTAQELTDLTLDHVRKLNLGALTTQRQVGMMAMLKHLQKLGAAGEAAAGDTNGPDANGTDTTDEGERRHVS